MASGFFAILDDVALAAKKISTMAAATQLDDIGSMAAAGTKASVAVVVDDFAATAGSAQGILNNREVRFCWELFKGSCKNKMYYLVPAALAINATVPGVMPALLMVGGGFLAYEGTHKLAEEFLHKGHSPEEEAHAAVLQKALTPAEVMEAEKSSIRDLLKTDMVLSAEIVAISLASITAFSTPIGQAVALTGIALGMSALVYGGVLGLLKIDDLGLKMAEIGEKRGMKGLKTVGQKMVQHAPKFFKGLGYVGTAAMLAVGGSLLMHGLHTVAPGVEHAIESAKLAIEHGIPGAGGFIAGTAGHVVEAAAALAAGAALIVAKVPEGVGFALTKASDGAQRVRQMIKPSASNKAAAPSVSQTPSVEAAPEASAPLARTMNGLSAPPAIHLGAEPTPKMVVAPEAEVIKPERSTTTAPRSSGPA